MAFVYNHLNNLFDNGDYWTSPLGITPITVTADGIILNFSGLNIGPDATDGLHLAGGSYTVTVNGIVGTSVLGGDGIEFNGITGLSRLTVGASGTIFGTYGVYAQHATHITNNGVIEAATTGILHVSNGNYTIANNGEINSLGKAIEIIGSGTHTISNKGTIFSDTDFAIDATAGGVERLTNTGKIFGDVNLGGGNDTFLNTGYVTTVNGSVTGNIFMGAGNDIFTGGIYVDFVVDEAGKDIYKLGGGNDTFFAVGLGSNDGNTDIVDGGTQLFLDLTVGAFGDIYDASLATASLSINLDSVARTDVIFSSTLKAKTAVGLDIGTDTISNFEAVVGGSAGDVIFGSATANAIDGGDGNDNLYGGAGGDFIIGGNGFDDIFGDAGRDFLDGGGADLTQDNFNYRALSDSTVVLAGRDQILFFEDGFDVIDFSRLNLALPTFVGVNQDFLGFTGTADVRAITTGSGWLIQLDKNGDLKVDLAIEVLDLNHAIVWDVTDFNL
jgi:RTX calcium-binding nonapeptide repeat (4 copies)